MFMILFYQLLYFKLLYIYVLLIFDISDMVEYIIVFYGEY